jgi:hypothetical protein
LILDFLCFNTTFKPSGNKPETDFQSKFLEFSQKKKEDQAGTDNLSESEKSKQEINQIAALLQKSEQLGHKLERRDSQKSGFVSRWLTFTFIMFSCISYFWLTLIAS